MFDINTMMRRSTRPRVKRAKRTVYGRKKRGVMRRKNPTHFFKRCAASFTISNSSATQGTVVIGDSARPIVTGKQIGRAHV